MKGERLFDPRGKKDPIGVQLEFKNKSEEYIPKIHYSNALMALSFAPIKGGYMWLHNEKAFDREQQWALKRKGRGFGKTILFPDIEDCISEQIIKAYYEKW